MAPPPPPQKPKKIVLLKDITVPAGTLFDVAANERGGVGNLEAVVGFGNDYTGWLTIDEDATEDAPEFFTNLK